MSGNDAKLVGEDAVGAQILCDRFHAAMRSKLQPSTKLVGMLRSHLDGVLA